MIQIEKINAQASHLEHLLRLQSMPIALKMVTSKAGIPQNALRPMRDRGRHLSFCQALAWTRRKGLTIAETRADMWCFEPVIGLGFVKAPRKFLDGHNRYPGSARNMPRFDYPKYKGIVTAPLEKSYLEIGRKIGMDWVR